MPNQKTYTLEYYVSKKKFPERIDLENYVNQTIGKLVENLSFEINDNGSKCIILSVTSTSKIISACYDKLNIERSWAFRSKDELDDYLREKAYPILSSIEITIRNFINQTMSEVLGFNWWDLFTPKNIQEKVRTIESKTGKSNVELHHQIEFTLFDDLIKIVTEEFQAWSDTHVITTSELTELLSNSATVEEIHEKLVRKRKKMSFWDDVFSNYFDDRNAWTQLKKKIEKHVIPVRNKVMHHRLIREYELKKLKEVHSEVIKVISSAKPQLSDCELKETSLNALAVFEIIQNSIPDYSEAIKKITDQIASLQVAIPIPDYSEMIQKIADLQVTVPDYSEAMKKITDQIASLQVAIPIPDYSEMIQKIADLQVTVPDYSEAMKKIADQIADLQVTIPAPDYSEMIQKIADQFADLQVVVPDYSEAMKKIADLTANLLATIPALDYSEIIRKSDNLNLSFSNFDLETKNDNNNDKIDDDKKEKP